MTTGQEVFEGSIIVFNVGFISRQKSAHLSKCVSDYKQNGMQEKKPFMLCDSTITHGMSVTYKTIEKEASDWRLKDFNHSEGGFWSRRGSKADLTT